MGMRMAKSITERPWDGRPILDVYIEHVHQQLVRPTWARPWDHWQQAVMLDADPVLGRCVPIARLKRAWRAVPRGARWEWLPAYLLITWDDGTHRGQLKLCTEVPSPSYRQPVAPRAPRVEAEGEAA